MPQVHGGWRFREDPPILTRVDEETRLAVTGGLERYADTLPRERRFMLNRYHVVDVAHRVVGVGSVGTRAYLTLLCGNSDQDVLFLQVKEAVTPALAPYLPGMPEPYDAHEGERVIYGQRLLQAVGDPLLGWTTIDARPFYVRQMKNMKGDIPAAHARTGDVVQKRDQSRCHPRASPAAPTFRPPLPAPAGPRNPFVISGGLLRPCRRFEFCWGRYRLSDR